MFGLTYLKNICTLKLDKDLCNGCQSCIEVCPHNVFAMNNKRASIEAINSCMECGACELNCPVGAISVRSGVGCAAAVITGMLKGTEPTCGCDQSEDTSSVGCC